MENEVKNRRSEATTARLIHYILITSIGLNMMLLGLYIQAEAVFWHSTNNLLAIWTAITGVFVLSFGIGFGFVKFVNDVIIK